MVNFYRSGVRIFFFFILYFLFYFIFDIVWKIIPMVTNSNNIRERNIFSHID